MIVIQLKEYILVNIIMIHYQFCIRKVRYCKSNSLFKKTTNCEDPKASCERPGETRGVWSSGQYQLWHQTVTTVTQVRVVTRLWTTLCWVWLHWPGEQSERERPAVIRWPVITSAEWSESSLGADQDTQTVKISREKSTKQHAPRANQSQGKLSWNLRHFAKLFLSLGIVPYPDDLYLSPVAPQQQRGNSIIHLDNNLCSGPGRGLRVHMQSLPRVWNFDNPGTVFARLGAGVIFQHFDCRVSRIVSATRATRALTN